MIGTIISKEWLELRTQRSLLAGVIIPPILLSILPVVIMYVMRQTTDSDTADLGIVIADPTLAGLTMIELGQAVIGKQFSLMLLLMPVILSSIIASYSVVGEKTSRTLEPVLATPISTWELLIGKSLTALIPALLATWFSMLLFSCGTWLVSLSPAVRAAVLSPGWLLAMLLCAPSLALIAIGASVAISSRVNDPRTAQQISAVAIIPLMAIFFAQLAGLVVLSVPLALVIALVLALLAAAALWLAVLVFQRESILTRWK